MSSLLYELPIFQHIDVKNVEEALFWLHKFGEDAKIIAGGTDLLCLMKDRIEGPNLKIPKVLVNIKAVPKMNRLECKEDGGLRIGAAVTLDRLEKFEKIKKFNILAQAASKVGTTQIRKMGTLGGNICQRPRCMYFRHPHFLCYKKGGAKCYATKGEHKHYYSILKYGPCVMAHPSDMAPALIALNAKVTIASSNGERHLSLKHFFLGPRNHTETILKPEELVTEIDVPNPKGETYQLFLKHQIRKSTDFAISSIAMVAQISEGTCEDIRIVLGGVAPFPYVVSKAEEVVRGKELNKELISKVIEISLEEVRPLPMNKYKVDLTKALIKRALEQLNQKITQVH